MANNGITDKKTVFVIGAGASKEVGLPIGSELKKSIANFLNYRFEHGYQMVSGDALIADAFRVAATKNQPPSADINPYLHTSRHIREALPQAISIDNFIDVHSDDKKIELCGKLSIVRSILDAESKSTLYVNLQQNEKLKFNQIEDTWFNSFWQLLTENCKVADLEERLASIALIVFNYDRCIEHFLYHALQNYYSLDNSQAARLLKGLEIHHPYGTVGHLPWVSPHQAVAFGATPNPTELLELASQIKTFTEGTDVESSQVTSIRTHMRTSPRMVFLGFAFHRLNMEILFSQPSSSMTSVIERNFYATGLGISNSDVNLIKAEIFNKGITTGNVTIRNDLKCSELLLEYWRSMSFVQ